MQFSLTPREKLGRLLHANRPQYRTVYQELLILEDGAEQKEGEANGFCFSGPQEPDRFYLAQWFLTVFL